MTHPRRDFPQLNARRIDIASRWAIRSLVRHSKRPKPDVAALARYYDRILSAFTACENHLHYEWVKANARERSRWRRGVRNLLRNPSRLREFAAKESYAQFLRYGAARLDATKIFNELIRQMEAEPTFLERVISAALEEDIPDKTKRLLHEAGGRPREADCYRPIVNAAAEVFQEVTGRPFGRSTSSATKNDLRAPGRAIGPGVEFLKRLLAVFPGGFTHETIAHLIRNANKQ